MEILMEFINYIMLILWGTFEIIFVSICPFLLLAYLMQLASGFIRNRISSFVGSKVFAYFTAIGVVVQQPMLGKAILNSDATRNNNK